MTQGFNPIGYNGRGSQLLASIDAVNFTPVAQLTRFEPSGSKQNFVDQTSLTSPGVFMQPLPVQVDSGEFTLEGLANPTNLMLLQLGVWHGSLTLVYWQVRLPDGSTYSFQAYVSEFAPFKVQLGKYIRFSAKLRITGGIEAPVGVFDPAVFNQSVFNCGLI